MADPSLDYKINISSDTKGASDAQKAIDKVKDSVEKTGQKAKTTAKDVDAVGESFERGAAAGGVLAQALQGNLSAITQLGPAIKGLGTLLKTNLIGALFTLGAVAAQVIVPMVKGFQDSKKGLDEVATAAKRADQALQLRKDSVEAVGTAISELSKEANKAEKELRDLQTRADLITDANLGLELAKIRARPDISSEARADLEFQARQTAEKEKFNRGQQTAEALLKNEQRTQTSAGAKVGTLEDDLRRNAELGASLVSKRSILEKQLEEARSVIPTNPTESGLKLLNVEKAQQALRNHEESLKVVGERGRLLVDLYSKAKTTAEQTIKESETRAADIARQRNLDAELFGINQQTTNVDRRTAVAPRLKELRAKASEQALAGDFAGQDRSVAEIKLLESGAAQRENTEATRALTAAIGQLAGKVQAGVSNAAPGTFEVDGQVRAIDRGDAGSSISIDGRTVPFERRAGTGGTIKFGGQQFDVPAGEGGAIRQALKSATAAVRENDAVVIQNMNDLVDATVETTEKHRKISSRIKDLRQ